jgi:hypothetical protein
MPGRMNLRRAFLRFAPWGLAACFAILAVMAVVLLAAGVPRGALAMVILMLGLVATVVVFIGGAWLILWPRATRPPLGQYLGAYARGNPLAPPGVTPDE